MARAGLGWGLVALTAVACSSGPGATTADAAVVADAPTFTDAVTDNGYDLPVEPAYQELYDRIEAERIAHGVGGAAVLMMRDGEIVFAHGFGDSGHADGVPAHASSLFRIGSVTKMLTATALLHQVGAGTIGLDETVVQHVPEFTIANNPAEAATITLRHLLTHQGAFADWFEFDGPHDDAGLREFVLGDFADYVYLMAPPGRMFNYANPNFYVAGMLLEDVTAMSYRDAVRTQVLAPLGMDRTTFLGADVEADGDYVNGYTKRADGTIMTVTPTSYDNAWGRPAGHAFSSVYDLAAFVRFLADGNEAVLPAAQRMAMLTPQVDKLEYVDVFHYGFGVTVQDGVFTGEDFHRTNILGHAGDVPGFAASVTWLPETGFALIMLAGGDVEHFTSSREYAMATFANLPAASAAPDATIDPSTFDRYTGTFIDPDNAGPMIVTHVGDDLVLSMPVVDDAGLPYEPVLEPFAPDNFVLYIQGAELLLTFIFDAEGNVEYARTRPFVGRIDNTPAPFTSAPGPMPSPARLRALLSSQLSPAVDPWPASALARPRHARRSSNAPR